MNRLKVIVSVTNDLSTDQRVHKVCDTLYNQNYDVLLVGRKLKNSLPLISRNYKTKRMHLFFTKGVWFYAEYQIRLFFFLLLRKFDVAHANDLDTLLPNFLVSKLKQKQLVYDTHEYFTEVPELQNNAFKKQLWVSLERYIFPKLRYVFTVNKSIADVYQNLYQVPVHIMRNVPLENSSIANVDFLSPPFLNPKKYVILQGAGINMDRGAEELVMAMQYVSTANLLIVGDGDVLLSLKKIVEEKKLSNSVYFMDKQPYSLLMLYTKNAAIGVTLDKDTNLNYKYSLPNKLFDYVRAEIPILASPLIETKRIFSEYEIGSLIENHSPEEIASKINYMLTNQSKNILWKQNLKHLSAITNWETESKELVNVYTTFLP